MYLCVRICIRICIRIIMCIPTHRWPSATFVDAHSMIGSCRSCRHLDAMCIPRALCIAKFPIPTAVYFFLPPSVSMRYALAT